MIRAFLLVRPFVARSVLSQLAAVVLLCIAPAQLLAAIGDAPTDDMRAPGAFARVPPQYPFEMRKAGLHGDVLVEFIVTSEGNVVNAKVVESTHPGFNDAAI